MTVKMMKINERNKREKFKNEWIFHQTGQRKV